MQSSEDSEYVSELPFLNRLLNARDADVSANGSVD